MGANMLMFNQENTELIIFKRKYQVKVNDIIQLQFGEKTIDVVRVVNNLGKHYNTSMTLNRHVYAVPGVWYYHIHNIGRIKQCLMKYSCKTLAHVLVKSLLHYDNGLQCVILNTMMNRLLRVQNSRVQLATDSRRR